MINFNEKYKEYSDYFNSFLDDYFSKLNDKAPKLVKDAMAYAIKDGGKRIRPVLCFATAEALGLKKEDVIYEALAIEMIHSYSLVHDDLPAMDNDDFRRGKFSTHKKFGEANGILAGDALLNLAYETCLNKPDFNTYDANALRVIADCAGYSGMIAGQILDLEAEKGGKRDENLLLSIYENKTGKLIIAPLLAASAICGNKYFDELKELGYNLGIIFQFTDDILDVEGTLTSLGKTPNKDLISDKFTSVAFYGLDGAKRENEKYYQKCLEILNKIPNSEFLIGLVNYVYSRKS
ncbi:MAG: polyprenyl synthetase family protein [Clostridia bacterium]|nr:polyprenyl synthetase family protein [Clostridia bacterium]